jgi:hypothetical protein
MTKSITFPDGGGIGKRGQRRPLHILTAHDAEKLTLFYLGLDFDGRRSRFAAAVSGQSIIRYCQTLDWHRSIIVGRPCGYFFDAILEIHPLSPGWGVAEIVPTCPLLCKTTEIFAQLIQLAALLAGQRSCHTFVVARDGCCREVFTLLNAMGTVRIGADQFIVDVADYALAGAGSAVAPASSYRQATSGNISPGKSNHAHVHPHPGKRSTSISCGSQMSG